MNLQPDDPSIHSLSQLNFLLHQSSIAKPKVRDGLFTANQLARHGFCDDASRVIDRVAARGHRNETLTLRLERLVKTVEQARAISGLGEMLADSHKLEKLLSFHSSIFRARGGSPRLVIVYSTAWNNFDISFPFLHCLIAGHADCILYVKNPERGMYATGNHEYGASMDQLSSSICKLIAGLNPSRVAVMGFSGGGYAALHLAAMAGADAFLGLGIRTDFSRESTFAAPAYRTAPCESDYANNTLVNMRDLPRIAGMERALLYFGDRDDSDRENALNMEGLPNFRVHAVARGSHNLVLDLLVSGQLSEVLHNFLD